MVYILKTSGKNSLVHAMRTSDGRIFSIVVELGVIALFSSHQENGQNGDKSRDTERSTNDSDRNGDDSAVVRVETESDDDIGVKMRNTVDDDSLAATSIGGRESQGGDLAVANWS